MVAVSIRRDERGLELRTTCCIAGGGPAGMMLGLLLARAGVDVLVLEKHGDFLRDFRGDTIHPSTLDVVHDFYVPEFRAKMDMIPGSVTYYWFTPTRVGTFEALCAELCGIGHFQMRGSVVVELESDHRTWLLLQKTFAQLRAPVRADAGN